MEAATSRRIDVGMRSLDFSKEHPDPDPGHVAAVARLAELISQALILATMQRDGIVDVRVAAARKAELQRAMLSGPISNLNQVGKVAAKENAELGKVFQFKPSAQTQAAVQTSARSMLTAAQTHRELLVKHGLAEAVLDEFARSLDEFDRLMLLSRDGRAAHTSATRSLNSVAVEIVRTVRLMDARNRQRFQGDRQLLEEWISRSRLLGTPRGTAAPPPDEGAPPADQEKPAA